MPAIRVEFLRCVSTAADVTRRNAEWPPHPDRVFQALTAALHRLGATPPRRAVLELLESSPWSISCATCSPRPTLTVYQPTNDNELQGKPKKADGDKSPLPHARFRAEAQLVAVDLPYPVVHYLVDLDNSAARALDELCRAVPYVGSSDAPVACCCLDAAPTATLVPVEGQGDYALRTPYRGRLADLEAAYKAGRRAPPRWRSYQRLSPRGASDQRRGEFARLHVLEADGRGVDGVKAAPLAQQLRSRILAAYGDPLPAWISGHQADGAPLTAPHLAVVPLPFVGRPYADGRILGLGLAVPEGASAAEAAQLLRAIDGVRVAGQIWTLGGAKWSTTAATWTRPSRRWVSATPLEIRRRDRRAPVAIAAEWAQRAGLPEPASAWFRAEGFLPGAEHAGRFLQGRHQRLRMHAEVVWQDPVSGPVLLGMGRYRGLGLMRPTDDL